MGLNSPMDYLNIIILAVIQGFAELLPVSSSAHVIFAEHLLKLDPSKPEMTFLLVMLHTGTMFAVLFYFWNRWKNLVADKKQSKNFIQAIIIATGVTGVLGLGLKIVIEKIILEHLLGYQKGEVEQLFSILPLIATSLFAVGIFIIYAGKKKTLKSPHTERTYFDTHDSIQIGFIQGLCLPFRGFSRSGATISTALLRGISRATAEDFSFALAVVLTPAVILLELKRLLATRSELSVPLSSLILPNAVGMLVSFLAGLVALKWLSSWLERGRWHYFGYYCLIFSAVVFAQHFLQ
jgi:undecaprenyl-diphosphatase